MGFDERVYQVALTMLPGIGPVSAKRLVSYCGSAGEVFRQKKNQLLKIPHIGEATATALKNKDVLIKAENELKYCERKAIQILFYLDKEFPNRLKQCYDAPALLYFQGNISLDHKRIISIVGTRKVTPYGEALTEKLLQDFAEQNILIVSGLAYGVDICAHRAALNVGLPTIGVLAHGLDLLYPAAHKSTAKKMIEQGGLLTDFPSGTKLEPENFPMRNRIVAGLSDATIVIESGESGGSMITAEFSNNYNRDVFAFPGRVGDLHSAGCHKLIKKNKAALVESASDILAYLSWDETSINTKSTKQSELILPMNLDEEKIVAALRDQGNVYIDEICSASGYAMGKVSAILLQLEFAGVVKSLPGKFYRLQ
ncbi:MAG: DNA-processing protein DprA [Bacteroidetes bacterium]|nr:DNA-processing protein DprA [Bacteroidota bacterium]